MNSRIETFTSRMTTGSKVDTKGITIGNSLHFGQRRRCTTSRGVCCQVMGGLVQVVALSGGAQSVGRLLTQPCMHPCFLLRLTEGGLLCPEVVLLKKNILVMNFIGHDQRPAPTLKEAALSVEQMTSAYQQCIKVCVCVGWRILIDMEGFSNNSAPMPLQ